MSSPGEDWKEPPKRAVRFLWWWLWEELPIVGVAAAMWLIEQIPHLEDRPIGKGYVFRDLFNGFYVGVLVLLFGSGLYNLFKELRRK